ncbi:MAG: hypothetical protein ACUVT8_11930 [Armatimonadota bacterium]
MLLLVVAIGFQGSLPGSLSLFGAKPDLVLVILIIYSLFMEPITATGIGLIAGALHGFAVGTSLGSFIFTRMLTGFLAGFSTVHVFSENLLVPAVSALILTAVCEGVFLLANPIVATAHAWRIILGESICNACLVFVICWLMRVVESRRKMKIMDSRIF